MTFWWLNTVLHLALCLIIKLYYLYFKMFSCVLRQWKQEATDLTHLLFLDSSNATMTNSRPQICMTSLLMPQKHSVWSQSIYTSVALYTLTSKGSLFSVPLKPLNRRRGYWKLRNAKQAISGRLLNREWYLYICRRQVEEYYNMNKCPTFLYFGLGIVWASQMHYDFN